MFGEDHEVLGEIAVVDLGPATAIGMSRGKYPKGYRTLDLNEDACTAGSGAAGILLAVADGHWGFDAARAALQSVRDSAPELLDSGRSGGEVVQQALAAASEAVRHALAGITGERAGSRTTLTVALVGASSVVVGGFGDSKAARIRRRSSRSLWQPAPFLGADTNLADRWLSEAPLRKGDWVVVASDGLLDFLGSRWPRRLEDFVGETASKFVVGAIEAAFEGGAGDHIALAVSQVPPS